MNKEIGMLINGLCRELSGGKWDFATHDQWSEVLDRNHRAVKVLGGRALYGRLHMVVLCDDGRVRAVPMRAFDAMERSAQREQSTGDRL